MLRRLPDPADADRWNHNINYHRDLLAAVPPGAHRALDVGCGDGMLVRELARSVPNVVGIDPDGPSIEEARATSPVAGVEYIEGDVLTHPFAPASFDVVVSVMALHHMDTRSGLRRMAELLRPGGVLGVIGAGQTDLPRDVPYEVAGALSTRIHKLTKSYWEHPSPMVWPPPDTYAQLRRITAEELPGCVLRRKVLWRYVLTWTKP